MNGVSYDYAAANAATNDTKQANLDAERKRLAEARKKALADRLAKSNPPPEPVTRPNTAPPPGGAERDAFVNSGNAGGTPPPVQSQYDIARSRVTSEAEKEKARRSEALKARLAAQGMVGSGLAMKQERGLEQDIGRESAAQLGDIASDESAAIEARNEAALGREHETQLAREKIFSEEGMTYAKMFSDENIAYAELDQSERKLAEEGRQFDSEMDFKNYALEAGFEENAIDRAWNAIEEQRDRDATSSDIGLKGEEDRKSIAARGSVEEDLANLASELRNVDANLEDVRDQKRITREAQGKAAYNLGFSKTDLTPDQEAMLEDDAGLKAMYDAGMSGRDYEASKQSAERLWNYQDTLLTAAADPMMLANLEELGKSLGYVDSPDAGTTGDGADTTGAVPKNVALTAQNIKAGGSAYIDQIKGYDDPVYQALLKDPTIPKGTGLKDVRDTDVMKNAWSVSNFDFSYSSKTPVIWNDKVFTVVGMRGHNKAGRNNITYTLRNLATGELAEYEAKWR
jgi:hypothetical protein